MKVTSPAKHCHVWFLHVNEFTICYGCEASHRGSFGTSVQFPHLKQMEISVRWVCILQNYVMKRSLREWMQEWRNVPLPGSQIAPHWPRPITYQTYLAWCVTCTMWTMLREHFQGIVQGTRQIKLWWLHLGRIIERKRAQERLRLNWRLRARWVFHVSTHHYQDLESFAVKTNCNDFFHYSCVCGTVGHSLQLIQRWNTKPVWKQWTQREYPIDMQSCIRIKMLSCSINKAILHMSEQLYLWSFSRYLPQQAAITTTCTF